MVLGTGVLLRVRSLLCQLCLVRVPLGSLQLQAWGSAVTAGPRPLLQASPTVYITTTSRVL